MLKLALLTSLISSFAVAIQGLWQAEQGTLQCGEIGYYDPSAYNCFETDTGYSLCPISAGVTSWPCGQSCYISLAYSCSNGALIQHQPWKGTFTLSVVAPDQDYEAAVIQANGGKLVIGGTSSSYCPDIVPFEDCPYSEWTAYTGNYLSAIVPGGQEIFTTTDGHIAYTSPHSSSEPDLLYEGAGTAFDTEGYFAPNGTDWLACKAPGSSDQDPLHLIADVPGRTYTDCDKIYLRVKNQADDYWSAWEYL